MTEIEEYAVGLVHVGAADCVQEDMNEDGELGEADWRTARDLGSSMATAIRNNQDSFLAWYRGVA